MKVRAYDLIACHVTMEHDGRTLLGTVTGTRRSTAGDRTGRLEVRHFNGEPWPVSPRADAVTVLERTWEGDTDR